jgi:DnaJ-class molecular chaperone
MKRINEYKKLFNADAKLELKTLKSTYRSLVKEWHPDKFQEGDPMAAEAELKSQKIIDAYHFLVSISPETKAATLDEYKAACQSGIADFTHKGQVLQMTFVNGATYEYFGVSERIYMKLINSDKQMRFAKRTIFDSFLYRKSKREAAQE